ncbi:phage major capsid protein [Candidatus Nesciobacter abundans]|uniref:Phage major capsid protein n=1 Tax=Candidatus Nesciobacter abundans TaxID=2601668 RepID=A0A5C0UJR1_9PROT|nr:phage major capsid protein [Candidatus Nesciobacter abundans]QEK39044.1 phage major capsid protein [Candidatus Nesciobacter abundans]
MNILNNKNSLKKNVNTFGGMSFDGGRFEGSNLEKQLDSEKQPKSEEIPSNIEKKSYGAPQTWGSSETESVSSIAKYIAGNFSDIETKSMSNSFFNSISTNRNGHYVPDESGEILLENDYYFSPIRSRARTIFSDRTTCTVNKFNSPEVTETDPSTPYQIGTKKLELSKETLSMHALQICIPVSQNSDEIHSIVDFEEAVNRKMCTELSERERNLFISGVDGKIDSIIPSESQTMTGKLDDNYISLRKMLTKLELKYHKNAVWFMTPETYYEKVLGLSDANKRPILNMDQISSDCNSIFGKEVVFVEELRGSGCDIILADLESGYLICENKNIFYQEDPFSEKPMVLHYMRKYMCSKVIDEKAFVGFKESA